MPSGRVSEAKHCVAGAKSKEDPRGWPWTGVMSFLKNQILNHLCGRSGATSTLHTSQIFFMCFDSWSTLAWCVVDLSQWTEIVNT